VKTSFLSKKNMIAQKAAKEMKYLFLRKEGSLPKPLSRRGFTA
jgi:hypothetical protein